MSDTVDDLHAAEDFAGRAVAALQTLYLVVPASDRSDLKAALSDARTVLTGWAEYCRPTCGAEGDPDSEECDDADCGCPCGHADHADPADDREPPERELPGDEP